MNNPDMMDNLKAAPAFAGAPGLGIVFLLLLILSAKLSLKHQNAFLQAGKLSLYLRVKVLSMLLFLKFRCRFFFLNCKEAYLQFLRCKFWIIHGYDVMDVPLPNDEGSATTDQKTHEPHKP